MMASSPRRETPLYFGDGAQLFGVRHEPAGSPSGSTVVVCHAFAEEKLWSHRVLVSLARRLADGGRQVLRFDCRGNGDSGGEFSASSLQSNLADIHAAIDEVVAGSPTGRVTLVGVRLGASEAALVAARRADVDRLVLWAPVVNVKRYMQDLLRVNLTTQLAVYGSVGLDREALVAQLRAGQSVNVDGYEMTWPLFSEMSAVDLREAPPLTVPSLLVHLDRGGAPPGAELRALADAWPAATLTSVQEEPFWKEILEFYDAPSRLFDATLGWLTQP